MVDGIEWFFAPVDMLFSGAKIDFLLQICSFSVSDLIYELYVYSCTIPLDIEEKQDC